MSQKVIKLSTREPKHYFTDTDEVEEALIEESIEVSLERLRVLGVSANSLTGGLDKTEHQLLADGVKILENAAKLMGVGFQQGLDGKVPPNMHNVLNSMAYLLASTYVGGSVAHGAPLSIKALMEILDELLSMTVGLTDMIMKGVKKGQASVIA